MHARSNVWTRQKSGRVWHAASLPFIIRRRSESGCVDMDISELLISQRECHRALLVLMFILGIPHSCKCQFMQRGSSVCTALGCGAWQLACHASKMWLKSLCAAVFRLNEKTFFLAEIFICYESQSSSLKWSGYNVFVLLLIFLFVCFLQHN